MESSGKIPGGYKGRPDVSKGVRQGAISGRNQGESDFTGDSGNGAEKGIFAESIRKIEAPITEDWELQFDTGGVAEAIGPMQTGKSIVLIASLLAIVERLGFKTDHCFGNIWIDLPGYHQVSNAEMRDILYRAFNTEVGLWRRCIFVVMECDSVYSHLDKGEDVKTELLHLSQCMRLNDYVLYEYHEGLGVTKFLRDKTEISLEVKYNRIKDSALVSCINSQLEQFFRITIKGMSKYWKWYKRFQPIK